MRTMIFTIFTFFAVWFFNPVLIAGQYGGKQNRGPKGNLPMQGLLLKDLNLPQDKIDAIKRIHQKYQDKIKEALEKNKEEQEKYDNLLVSDASKEEIIAQHAKLQEARRNIGQLKLDVMLEIRDLLTLEQRKMLHEKIKQRYHKRWDNIDNF